MSELRLPSDYERLRPFRRLVRLLQERRVQTLTLATPGEPVSLADEVMCEMAASFLSHRLWYELALLARSTNRPGWLPSEDRRTYEKTVAAIFGDDCKPVDLLVESGMLQSLADGWFCDLFAKLNPHTAGDYQSKEERGAHHSALVRNKQRIAAESYDQLRLLPAESFLKADGEKMTEREALAAMNVIKTLDKCVNLSAPRPKAEYSQGLMLDAFLAAQQPEEVLTEVYLWLRANRQHQFAPKSAEEVLRDFDRYRKLAGGD